MQGDYCRACNTCGETDYLVDCRADGGCACSTNGMGASTGPLPDVGLDCAHLFDERCGFPWLHLHSCLLQSIR